MAFFSERTKRTQTPRKKRTTRLRRRRNPSAPPPRARRAWVLLERCEDLPDQWFAQCLAFNIVSQGNSVAHALDMVLDAIRIVFENEIEQGHDPFARSGLGPWRKPAKRSEWARLARLIQEGMLGTQRELTVLEELDVDAVATQIVVRLAARARAPKFTRTAAAVVHAAA